MENRHLTGQHAIVTGGGRGIGAAVSRSLAAFGARVSILGRDAAVLERHARELRDSLGADVAPERCDVSDETDVARAFAAARARFGDAEVLVNNAGQAESLPFLDTSRALWDRLFAVNVTSVYLCTRQALPAMVRAGKGRVINVASTAGLRGYGYIAAYSATKHAVVGLTRSLALEVRKSGVTVNAVCPGYTDTDMAERGVQNVMKMRGVSHDEARAMLARTNARGTLVTTEEVANAVVWLTTAAGGRVNGEAIAVAAGEAV